MKVTCPKCQLKGSVDTGPLTQRARILCVRCATSYEALLVDGEVEMSPSRSFEGAQAAELPTPAQEARRVEAGQDFEEPLDLPAPLLLHETPGESEHALEELFSSPDFNRQPEHEPAPDAFAEAQPDQDLPETAFPGAQPSDVPVPESSATETQAREMSASEVMGFEIVSEAAEPEMFEEEAEPLSFEATASEDEAPEIFEMLPDESPVSEMDVYSEPETSEAEVYETLPAAEASSFEVTSFEASSPEATASEASSFEASTELSPEVSFTEALSSSEEPSAEAELDEARLLPFEAQALPLSLEAESQMFEEPEQADARELSQPPLKPPVSDEARFDFAEAARNSLPYQDKYSAGVRLMRVSPVWLFASGLLFISLIFLFNWATKPDAQATGLAFRHETANSSSNQSAHPPVSRAAAQSPEKRAATTGQESAPATPAAPPANASSPAAPAVTSAPAVNPATAQSPAANGAPETKPAPMPKPEQKPEQAEGPKAKPAVLAPVQPESRTGGGNFTVQVGSYSDSSQAAGRAANLKSAGFEAHVVAVEIPGRGTWYRVQSGGFNTRDEASRYALQLRSQKAASEAIVTESQRH